jgi:hypothetical protein
LQANAKENVHELQKCREQTRLQLVEAVKTRDHRVGECWLDFWRVWGYLKGQDEIVKAYVRSCNQFAGSTERPLTVLARQS